MDGGATGTGEGTGGRGPTGSVGAVVFDVGGVLVRLGGVERMVTLSGMASADAVWARWLTCPWVRDFERGRCTVDEFVTGVIASWDLDVTPEAFLAEFASWPEAPLPGAAALVTEVASAVPTACLANTNAVHWDVAGGFGVVDGCTVRFLSHELGMVKPDAEVFDHVAGVLGLDPGRILFLDDLESNVAGARSRGFVAARVTGPDEARTALVAAGVLPGRSPGVRS